jgi:DNA-directed RNA polymerase sigma subunit (sigma70/sigma32)
MSNEREREILRLRANGLTLRQVGERFGVSRERIRQIEYRAIERDKRGARKLDDLSNALSQARTSVLRKLASDNAVSHKPE